MNAYYKDQLAKISGNDLGYPAQIKITKNSDSTHWLSLNDESATALVNWLTSNYNVNPGIVTIQDLEDNGEIPKAY